MAITAIGSWPSWVQMKFQLILLKGTGDSQKDDGKLIPVTFRKTCLLKEPHSLSLSKFLWKSNKRGKEQEREFFISWPISFIWGLISFSPRTRADLTDQYSLWGNFHDDPSLILCRRGWKRSCKRLMGLIFGSLTQTPTLQRQSSDPLLQSQHWRTPSVPAGSHTWAQHWAALSS